MGCCAGARAPPACTAWACTKQGFPLRTFQAKPLTAWEITTRPLVCCAAVGVKGRARGLLDGWGASSDPLVVRFNLAVQGLELALNSSSSGSDSAKVVAAAAAGAAPHFPIAACPADLQLGVRPQLHAAPELFGGKCEPWAGRRAVLLLQQLLTPDMVGLEWGAGASTLWYLGR